MSGEEGTTGAEAGLEIKGGSTPTFADIDEAMEAYESEKKAAKKTPTREREEAESNNGKKEGKEKPAKEAKAEKTKENDESDDAPEAKPEKPAPKPEEKPQDEKPTPGRPKQFKAKHGDTEMSLSSNTVVSIPKDGKVEDWTLAELVKEANGKGWYEKKAREVEATGRAAKAEKVEFENTVKQFAEKAQKDPDSAMDFLAQLSGADVVELKMNLLKSQIENLRPFFQMDEAEQAQWLKDHEREFREKKLTLRETMAKEKEESAKAKREREDAARDFGIDETTWSEIEEKVAQAKKDQGREGPVTTRDIVVASRQIMAVEAVQEFVPELAKHPKIGNIMDDVLSDLLRHPGITKQQLGALLKREFGSQEDTRRDDDNARATANRIATSSRADTGEATRRTPREDSGAAMFDDL